MPSKSPAQALLGELKRHPVIASDLYDKLERRGYKRALCRATVARLRSAGRIHRARLNLAHNNSILSLDGEFATPRLVKTLVASEFRGRTGLANLIKCLQTTHPVLDRAEAAKLAVMKIGTLEHPEWRETDALLAGLSDLGILVRDAQHGESLWVSNKEILLAAGLQFSNIGVTPAYTFIRRKVRFAILKALKDWLMQNTFVSRRVQVADPEKPVVSYALLPFDLLGFSFASGIGIRKPNGVKPTPVVGDVLLDACNNAYAQSFCSRAREARVVGKMWPVAFILAKGFTKDAHATLKRNGVLAWATDQLLGKKTAAAIKRILQLSETLLSQKQLKPKAFKEAFEAFENLGGLFGDLKGDIFELMIGYFFQKRGHTTKLGWKVDGYDVDLLAQRTTLAIIVECKGISSKSEVPLSEIRRHVERRTPAARRRLSASDDFKPSRFQALVVTTGKFEDRIAKAERSGELHTRADTSLALWDRKVLLRKMQSDGQDVLAKLVKRYF